MKSNTRKVLLGSATVAALAVAGGMAKDGQAANTAVKITAQILAPIKITKTQTLKFGKMTVKATSAGTVSVAKGANTRAAAGGVTLVGGTTANRGGYKLSGAKSQAFKITAPATVSITSGANKMQVTKFTHATKGAMNPGFTQTFPAGGTFKSQFFGATLKVGAAQATGTYTGTVTVTANYN